MTVTNRYKQSAWHRVASASTSSGPLALLVSVALMIACSADIYTRLKMSPDRAYAVNAGSTAHSSRVVPSLDAELVAPAFDAMLVFLSLLTTDHADSRGDRDEETSLSQDLAIDTKNFSATDELMWLVRRLSNIDGVRRVVLSKLHGSFSGALVLIMQRFRPDGRELPMSVLKYDMATDIVDEAAKTNTLGPNWGAAYPHVHDTITCEGAKGRGLMQIDLCGGALGLPGLTLENAVDTLASIVTTRINRSPERFSHDVPKIVHAVGHSLKRWSAPTPTTMNLFQLYETNKNIKKRIFEDTTRSCVRIPSLLPDGVTVGAFFADDFVPACESTDDETLRVTTGTGLCHNDFHGGNQLIDKMGVAFLIDFATAKAGGHSLNDLGKLVVSVLMLYTEIDPADDAAHESTCLRLAATPSDGGDGGFAVSPSATPRIRAVQEIIQAMWQHIEAMNCGGDGAAFVWVLLRHAVRMLSYAEITTDAQRARCLFLAVACAQRLLSDLRGDSFEWLTAARGEWEASAAGGTTIARVTEDEAANVRRSYLARMAELEDFQIDPISRQQISVVDACVCVEMQRFSQARRQSTRQHGVASAEVATGGAHARRPSMWLPTAGGGGPLAVIFPSGVPRRLMVVGGGGTGKTVMTKQIFVGCCQAFLAGGDAPLPFRFALPHVLPHLGDARSSSSDDAWAPLRACFEHNHGAGSVHVRALDDAVARSRPCLLLLDGLDEVSASVRTVLEWVGRFDSKRVTIVLTSRPVALDVDGAREKIGAMGFEGRRIVDLSPAKTAELAEMMFARLGATADDAARVREVLRRPEYASLARVPITLGLLVHVLLRREVAGTLTKAQVFEMAIELVVNLDAHKARFRGEPELLSPTRLRSALRVIALANHVAGARGQPWEAFAPHLDSATLTAVRQLDERGMPLLELSGGVVQSPHLNFQEAGAADAVAALLASPTARGPALYGWLVARAAEPWWSQVLVMALGALDDADPLAAALDALAADPLARLRVGSVGELSYGGDVSKVGRFRRVRVTRLDDSFATVSVVGGRCCGASLTVPRAVVILPATGVGVLALAAATAGATRLVEGLARAACTLESLRP